MRITDVRLPVGATRRRRRRGRGIGSGAGKTASRGTKGYRARSGSRAKPGFEGGSMTLIRRLPKRGFKNRFRVSYAVVNVGALDALAAGEQPVTPERLRAVGLVRRNTPVKILGDGACVKPLHVQAHAFSRTAINKLQQAGGRAETIRPKRSHAQ